MKRKGFRMKRDRLRSVRFAPYRKGMGPTFFLDMWDTHRTDRMGKSILGYRFGECKSNSGRRVVKENNLYRGEFSKTNCKILFEGEDFATPGSVDSDDAVRSLMGFLTLKPGDTDAEYFENYTPAQKSFARDHAESVQMAVIDKFGED